MLKETAATPRRRFAPRRVLKSALCVTSSMALLSPRGERFAALDGVHARTLPPDVGRRPSGPPVEVVV